MTWSCVSLHVTANVQAPANVSIWRLSTLVITKQTQYVEPTLVQRSVSAGMTHAERVRGYISFVEVSISANYTWSKGSVLGLRPPGLKFRILCLQDSAISFISSSWGGSPGQVNCTGIIRLFPANPTHWSNVGLLLGRRRRRWPNNKPTLFQCFVFAGLPDNVAWGPSHKES